MDNNNAQALQQLLKVFDTTKIVSPQDIASVLSGITSILASFKRQNEALNADTKTQVDELLTKAQDAQASWQTKIDQQLKNAAQATDNKIALAVKEASDLVAQAKAIMPEDGEDADPADVVPLVMEQVKPLLEKQSSFKLTGEEVLNALDQLPDDVGIDAKRIKNLPESKSYHVFGGSTSRVVTVKDEGTVISKLFRSMNFVGAGVQATSDKSGNITVTITGSSSSESNGETLTDSGNHTTFTFAHAPATGGVRNVWRKESGQLLTPTTDYTVSGSTLTATSAQVDGNGAAFTLIANYTY